MGSCITKPGQAHLFTMSHDGFLLSVPPTLGSRHSCDGQNFEHHHGSDGVSHPRTPAKYVELLTPQHLGM